MGKSNKKVKSDRINALRKQYDAFVEEDKKRKERNDYILGRLDKMRYCTTLVPVRQKAIPSINRPSTTILGYQPEVPVPRDIQSFVIPKNQLVAEVPISKIDDTYLINQISKNYILIPKLRSSFMNNCIQQAPTVYNPDIMQNVREMNTSNPTNVISNENNDWQSKYEILNILKNEETEKQVIQLADERIPQSHINKEYPENTVNNKAIPRDNEIIPIIKSESKNKYLDDVPEKDTSVEKINYELEDNTKDDTLIHAATPMSINNDYASYISKAEDNAIADIDYKLQNTNLDNHIEGSDANLSNENVNYPKEHYAECTVPQTLGEQIDYVEYVEPTNDANMMPEANYMQPNFESTKNDNNLLYNSTANPEDIAEFKSDELEKVDDIDHVQVISSSELMEKVNSGETIPNVESTDYIQYVTDNMKVQELTPNADLQAKPNADVTAEEVAPGKGSFDLSHQQDLNVGATQQQLQYVEGTQEYVESRQQIVEGAQPFVQDIEQFVEETQPFVQETEEFVEGTQQFVEKTQQLVEGTPQFAEGTPQFAEGTPQFAEGTPQFAEGIQQFVEGIQQRYPFDNETQQQHSSENITGNPPNVEDSVDIAGIEAFDTEQREMFYTENATDISEYQQSNPNTYNQEYPQNVPYEQNQDYAYYDNAYNPVDMGENEEQTTRYDQAYQQQYYVDPYEKAYNKEEDTPQVYESIQQGEMNEVEQVQYQGYNTNKVETALDSEEGYIHKTEEAQEKIARQAKSSAEEKK